MSRPPSPRQVEVVTSLDGFPLGVTLFPASEELVILSPAMATPQRFYEGFARHLQQEGFTVLTYDFRGVGKSAPANGSLWGFEASVSDWALQDMEAVFRWARSAIAPRRIYHLGHSLGGQLAGLLGAEHKVAAMVTVSAQSGYWKLQGGLQPAMVLFHVTFTLPILSRLFGYLPWSRFSKACDIPKGAAIQWARWCRHPDYLFSDYSLPLHRYQDWRAPILAYSISDDHWGTSRSVDAMMSRYPKVQRHHLVPADYGLKAIGHFGFFRSNSEQIWQEVTTFFRAH